MLRQIPLWGALVIATVAAAGCSSPLSSGRVSMPAQVLPQIDGIIQSIQPGDPSFVTLTNVTETGDGRTMTRSEEKIQLPPGRFVAPGHWQSYGDTLDLFVGEDFTLMTNTGTMMDSEPDPGFAGIVQSISPREMVVRKILYDTTSRNTQAMKATQELVVIHLAPYTTVTVNGHGGTRSVSVIHVGDPVLFTLIGPPTDYIATQITDFTSLSAAGWVLE